MQNVTHWFLVGYILGCRWWYMRVVRVVSLVGCKDYLSSHELSSLTYITPNESWNALCSLYAGGLLWARNYAQKGSVNSVGSVRERTPQELSSALSLTVGAFYFSQIYTEEQNTQRPTETLSQPISQSVTANLSWKASVFSVCRRRSVDSKLCAKRLSELCALCERKTPHCEYPTIFLSQKITEEQNTQGFTETLSQPISQNLTTNIHHPTPFSG